MLLLLLLPLLLLLQTSPTQSFTIPSYCFGVIASSSVLGGSNYCDQTSEYIRVCALNYYYANLNVQGAYYNRTAVGVAECQGMAEKYCSRLSTTYSTLPKDACCTLNLKTCSEDYDCNVPASSTGRECCSACERRLATWKCAGDNATLTKIACNWEYTCDRDNRCSVSRFQSGTAPRVIIAIFFSVLSVVISIGGLLMWLMPRILSGGRYDPEEEEGDSGGAGGIGKDAHLLLLPWYFLWTVNLIILICLLASDSHSCIIFRSALTHGPFDPGSDAEFCKCNFGPAGACRFVTAWVALSLALGPALYFSSLFLRVRRGVDPIVAIFQRKFVSAALAIILLSGIQSLAWLSIFGGVVAGIVSAETRDIFQGTCPLGSDGSCHGTIAIGAFFLVQFVNTVLITAVEFYLFIERQRILDDPHGDGEYGRMHRAFQTFISRVGLHVGRVKIDYFLSVGCRRAWNGHDLSEAYISSIRQTFSTSPFAIIQTAKPIPWRASPTGPNVRALAAALLSEFASIFCLSVFIESGSYCEDDGINVEIAPIPIGTPFCFCAISSTAIDFRPCQFAEFVGWVAVVVTGVLIVCGYKRFTSGLWSVFGISLRKITVVSYFFLAVAWGLVFLVGVSGLRLNGYLSWNCPETSPRCNRTKLAVGFSVVAIISYGLTALMEMTMLFGWQLDVPHEIDIDEVVRTHPLFVISRKLKFASLIPAIKGMFRGSNLKSFGLRRIGRGRGNTVQELERGDTENIPEVGALPPTRPLGVPREIQPTSPGEAAVEEIFSSIGEELGDERYERESETESSEDDGGGVEIGGRRRRIVVLPKLKRPDGPAPRVDSPFERPPLPPFGSPPLPQIQTQIGEAPPQIEEFSSLPPTDIPSPPPPIEMEDSSRRSSPVSSTTSLSSPDESDSESDRLPIKSSSSSSSPLPSPVAPPVLEAPAPPEDVTSISSRSSSPISSSSIASSSSGESLIAEEMAKMERERQRDASSSSSSTSTSSSRDSSPRAKPIAAFRAARMLEMPTFDPNAPLAFSVHEVTITNANLDAGSQSVGVAAKKDLPPVKEPQRARITKTTFAAKTKK